MHLSRARSTKRANTSSNWRTWSKRTAGTTTTRRRVDRDGCPVSTIVLMWPKGDSLDFVCFYALLKVLKRHLQLIFCDNWNTDNILSHSFTLMPFFPSVVSLSVFKSEFHWNCFSSSQSTHWHNYSFIESKLISHDLHRKVIILVLLLLSHRLSPFPIFNAPISPSVDHSLESRA